MIREIGCGLCVEPDDAQALADALMELKRNDSCRAEMSRKGRAAAETRFSLETIVEQYDALLRQVAAAN